MDTTNALDYKKSCKKDKSNRMGVVEKEPLKLFGLIHNDDPKKIIWLKRTKEKFEGIEIPKTTEELIKSWKMM